MLLANCLAHGRRQFVELTANFPEQCRYVLETLGSVYHYDAVAGRQKLSPEERLRLHREHSRPIIDKLHAWRPSFRRRRRSQTQGWGKPSYICCATGSR
jgi:transposase